MKASSILFIFFTSAFLSVKDTRKEIQFLIFNLKVLIFLPFLLVQCATLLPPEERIFPKNPVPLPKGKQTKQWLESIKEKNPKRFWWKSIDENKYKFTYVRQSLRPNGSHIACTAVVENKGANIELYEMAFVVNYADYTKSMRKGGDLGPLNEEEKTEILYPCIEEVLDSGKSNVSN